jgi:hypothetical protein
VCVWVAEILFDGGWLLLLLLFSMLLFAMYVLGIWRGKHMRGAYAGTALPPKIKRMTTTVHVTWDAHNLPSCILLYATTLA